ncbi:MAG: hypothetical protein Q9P14_00665 [candidate division KSB1 bacterium]|nr:hypothetical protein [candidate division KSB1 bacterium]MDQ7066349.1 hypothetical protein [candidate division KSB1 bacterium]
MKTRIGWLLLLFVMACAGASRVKIQDIVSNPSKWNEQEVRIKGTVVQTYSVPILGQSLVRVDDGSGRIWVKPRNRVYFKGDKIDVSGTVKVAASFGDKNFGFIVIEKDRKK